MRVLNGDGRQAVLDAAEARAAGVVVLERLPRGGGATNWFWCPTRDALTVVFGQLTAASLVTFVLDGRLGPHDLDDGLVGEATSLLKTQRDICVGWLARDGVTIEMDFPGGVRDLEAALCDGDRRARPFVGVFPGGDDGTMVITAVVPDPDGTVRMEPT